MLDAKATEGLPARTQPAWDSGRTSIEAKGVELGLGKWDQAAWPGNGGESFAEYTERVRRAISEPPEATST
jgi:broad specificity phosphatase PhoE